MLARTIIVLVSSPWYGILVSTITVPLMLAYGFVAGIVGTSSLVGAGILALSSVLFQAVIYAQSARYAGSFTGLQSIVDQPDFFSAVGRCLVVTIAVGILGGLVTAAFFLVVFKLGGFEEWWWMDLEKLRPAVQQAMKSPARAGEIFSYENLNLSSLIFTIEAITMFFLTIVAIFAVPRAVGLDSGYGRAYSLSLILGRFLIAFPFLMAMAGLASIGALALFQLAAGIVIDEVAITAAILYFLEIVVFTGMIFSFEAALLRTAREQAMDEVKWERAAEREDTASVRAIRESWNDRT